MLILMHENGKFLFKGSYTLEANLTYLAPPGQFLMGAKLFIGIPKCEKVSQNKPVLGYVKIHGFHGHP